MMKDLALVLGCTVLEVQELMVRKAVSWGL
jgi:hypothetical protein